MIKTILLWISILVMFGFIGWRMADIWKPDIRSRSINTEYYFNQQTAELYHCKQEYSRASKFIKSLDPRTW